MLSINSNISSLTAQENLNSSGAALSQAITRLSSGKRINSAADDSAGLAISTTLQTAINGLNQGVSNANDGVSMVQTASTGLSQITQSLQTIRSLAAEAAGGSMSTQNQQALQQDVAEQVAEVNRLASQTSYNGINLLNGTAGNVSVQVGASVGQTITINLSQGVSASSLGSGPVAANTVVGTITGLDLTSTGAANSAGGTGAITSINVVANGTGGFSFTDQNGSAISSSAAANLFTITGTPSGIDGISVNSGGGLTIANELASINSAETGFGSTATSGTVLGTLSGLSIDPTTGLAAATGGANTVTSITVESNGSGGFKYLDQNGNQLSTSATSGLFAASSSSGTLAFATGATPVSTIGANGVSTASSAAGATSLNLINYNNQPTSVANVNVSTTAGANLAMLSVDNALATINNIQATLGAAQNRLTGIATSQQAESTDLSSAQSQITDADFAQESANLSKAQVLQQAGISVLAQANSNPQQVLKLLQ
ncbi:flagellin [Paraburkholderia sp. DHOC27]|uniref:flagellin N-terminal helical domain-containing protein n=1 Tax=Paraburkholderia sp. DHOC27 TaxID=2303330 RepID=UPI000E3ECC60|nr:flagellin [Paraburkholderia sp. DHOC27]RFU47468.1 flagellin [Paraburkholderia sp. DHOC27]